MMLQVELLTECFDELATWMRDRQWRGTDPYDLPALGIYRATRGAPWPLSRVASRIWHFLERKAPYGTRRAFGVPARHNPTTFALVARAMLKRATAGSGGSVEACLKMARKSLEWLVEHPGTQTGSGKLGWGYPFTWHAGCPENRTVIAANVPLSVVSVEAGCALLDWFDSCHCAKAFGNARQVGQFLVSDLNRYEAEGGELCFSYGPTDTFQVINANLGVAAFLARLSSYTGDQEMRELARRARLYARNRQRPDGSWEYWGHQAREGKIDHYHTGMNLQWLTVCQEHDPMEEDRESLRKGAAFYMERMFEPDGAPRMLPDSLYPINIHSCAQAMITLNCLHKAGFEGAFDGLQKTCSWTLDNMRNPDGSFAYAIWKSCKDSTPHMRWGQAWTLWGLANAICAHERAEHACHDQQPAVARRGQRAS